MKDSIMFLFTCTLFAHVIADYTLQGIGIIASMKQKKWWEENYPQKLYKNDYKAALACHSFMWSFVVHIPLILFRYESIIIVSIFIHTIIHYIIDDLKANKYELNLIQDQILHLVQLITITFVALL